MGSLEVFFLGDQVGILPTIHVGDVLTRGQDVLFDIFFEIISAIAVVFVSSNISVATWVTTPTVVLLIQAIFKLLKSKRSSRFELI